MSGMKLIKVELLRYLNLLPDLFGHVGKRLEKKPKVNIKFDDVTTWLGNKLLQHTYSSTSQEVQAIRQWKFYQLIEYSVRNIFLQKSCRK